jgi:penicillin-binding protein 1A
MDTILVKILRPRSAKSYERLAVKTHSVAHRNQVLKILRAGFVNLKQAFDIESINIDDLTATALDDPNSMGVDIRAFHSRNFTDLNTAHRVIEFFNDAAEWRH